ncbi:hypothetical protein AAG906_011056 [Vitis piasezkii]|uniref:Spindle and kinetochore-associated protein 3 n=1 Tax=Vitis vinifera TaxID=29760 RepID=A0ABY9CB04_VITVI|nr:uncharacterized protein LOC100261551 [Vitis vinifera]WJZ92548.1 hypothetical protein VitviT2T_011536 [Vitis vinifera]|eukprot:XP_010653227.1 PREDICTED: uncharacterized protein LOC100261551 [Vitis vinifera]
MEDSIGSFCKTLASFCNHLHSSCHALKQSVDRRPIPLDSASSTFVQCLKRRISSASSDLNLLETMSFGTVSFEELLGHCSEVYKKNQSDLSELEDRLRDYGYVPNLVIDDDDDEASGLPTPLGLDSRISDSATDSIGKKFDEDPLSDESLSLKNLGLSEVCLATLASEAYEEIDNPNISWKEPIKLYEDKLHNVEGLSQSATKILGSIAGEVGDDLNSVGAPKSVINVSKNDYEQLPSYMKTLVSWEDLLATVEKMNSGLRNKERGNFFHQHELESLELGPKARSYLLLLVRMNLLVVETVDGSISYRVL